MENLIAQSQKKRRGKILPPPFVPYDWQTPIIKKMLDQILKGKSGLVIQPTATGKSTEAAFLARICALLHGKRGLYLYSENEGLDQAGKNFREVFGENHAIFANLFGGKKDSLTDADMVFASFQSLNHRKKKLYTTFPKNFFDYKIVNEAHHSEAVTYKEVIEYFECPHIGMTGTPDRMDGKDIRGLYEEVLFEMTLEEAITLGRVAKIEYHIMSHGLSTQRLKKICAEVLEEGKRISVKQLNENIFVEMLEEETKKEIYRYALPIDRKPLQTLVYCENTTHADRVYESFKKDGVKVERIHSKLSRSHNKDVMKAFREGRIQFLVSVNKLNEDIDVPNVELIALLRATDSYNIWAQQIGRGLRIFPGKNKLIVLDFVANAERLILVQEIMERVKEFATKEYTMRNDLEKGFMHVTGEGFDFSYSDQIVDVLKVLQVLREGSYPTWQEASIAAIALGVTDSIDYSKKYKSDLRLHSFPYTFYPDFPGWIFFSKKKLFIPNGRKQAKLLLIWGYVQQKSIERDIRKIVNSVLIHTIFT
jgi:superfamily II DNA or RNA helicase